MSADRQRLKSAIQRIAKEDPEIRNLLGEGKNKGGKASSAGVGTSEAEESRLCCDGSTSDNANPGTGERDPDAESQDGLDSSDPAKLASGDGTLSGVTDCATGDPICFDGAGFIPPEGWDDPNEPPILEGYDEDVYYRATYTGGGCNRGADFQTCDQAKDFVVSSALECKGDTLTKESLPCDGTGAEYSIKPGSCTGTSSPSVCDEPPPTEDAWPSDGCTNLAIKGGTIVGSKYDPENDGSYNAPRDSIDLCDSEGNQISLAPASNGGWKTINSTTNNGYLYDSSGQQIAHIDGTEYSDPNM